MNCDTHTVENILAHIKHFLSVCINGIGPLNQFSKIFHSPWITIYLYFVRLNKFITLDIFFKQGAKMGKKKVETTASTSQGFRFTFLQKKLSCNLPFYFVSQDQKNRNAENRTSKDVNWVLMEAVNCKKVNKHSPTMKCEGILWQILRATFFCTDCAKICRWTGIIGGSRTLRE